MSVLNKYYQKIKAIASDLYDEELFLLASSISFYTLFSLIPLVFLVLSVFVSLPNFEEYHEKIKNFIFSMLITSHQDLIVAYFDEFLKNSVKLGVLGLSFMIFGLIMFFQSYELTVNRIFQTKARDFIGMLTTYWTLVTLGPLGLALSFYLSNELNDLLQQFYYTSWINILAIFPFFVIWLLFFITYLISINIKVDVLAALISSFVSSGIWYLGKNLFAFYIISNKTYKSIYGSFSAVLFFLLWIYLSWVVLLYGLKLCRYLHNKRIKQKEEKEEAEAIQ